MTKKNKTDNKQELEKQLEKLAAECYFLVCQQQQINRELAARENAIMQIRQQLEK